MARGLEAQLLWHLRDQHRKRDRPGVGAGHEFPAAVDGKAQLDLEEGEARKLGHGGLRNLELQPGGLGIRGRPCLDSELPIRAARVRLGQHYQDKPGQTIRPDRETGQHAARHVEFVVYRGSGVREKGTGKYHAAEPTAK